MAFIVRTKVEPDENKTTIDPKEVDPEEALRQSVEAGNRQREEAIRQAQAAGAPMGLAPNASTTPTTTTNVTPTTPSANQGPLTIPLNAEGHYDITGLPGPQMAQLSADILASGVGTTSLQAEPQVLRDMPEAYAPRARFLAGNLPTIPIPASPLSVYKSEYAQHISDNTTIGGTTFRDWINRRAMLLWPGWDPDEPDYLGKGQNLWNTAGEMVGNNPVLKGQWTPERWLDHQYELAGGDAAYEAAVAAKRSTKPPPIVTTTSTQTYKINAAQAQAAVDDMSQQLLGRMASEEELKRARGAMQKLLTATVTTSTRDETDPGNIVETSSTKLGVGPDDAAKILQMRMQRGSEGMAFNAGTMFENALAKMS